jgi:replicative DNA helicase
MDQDKPKSLRYSNKTKLIPRDISESLGKLPPQAIDLEEAILGAMMLEKQGAITGLRILRVDDFYKESHQEIFSAMKALADKGDPIDMRSVVHQLRENAKLELIEGNGAYYIAELTSKVSSAANIEYQARKVQEMRLKRDVIMITSQIHQDAYEDTTDVFDLIDNHLIPAVSKIYDGLRTSNEKHVREGLLELANDINKREANKPEITGVPSGYPKFDAITSGFQGGNLIIIAGRPSMGKTTFALNCCRNASVDFNMPTAIFSLEMSYRELDVKLASMESNLSTRHITTKMFSQEDWNHFERSIRGVLKAEIYIDDTVPLSINQFQQNARRLVEKYKIKMIMVDYLQLMKGEGKGNREQEVASITRGLKIIAKELDIPIIALSQLSRDVEKRGGDCKPKLSDLRESGSIEQDADLIIFPYRPGYYKIVGDDGGTFIDGLTELIIAKHRNGNLWSSYVQMKPNTSRFINADSQYYHANNTAEAIDQRLPPPPPEPNPNDLPF